MSQETLLAYDEKRKHLGVGTIDHPAELPLTVQVVNDAETFHSLRDEWDECVIAANATIYQTHTWLSTWWKHFAHPQEDSLHIVLLNSGHRLVGIAPCFIHSFRVMGITVHRSLEMIGCGNAFRRSNGMFLDDGPSDYLDFIITPGFQREACHELANSFAKLGVDDLSFVNIPHGSVLLTEFAAELEARKQPVQLTRADVCPKFTVPPSLDSFLKASSANVRRRLSQARKAGESGEHFQVETINGSAKFKQSFDELVSLHQKRWNMLGYPGLFAQKRFLNFECEVMSHLLAQDRLWFKSARTNGNCLAGRLAMHFNGKFYDYLSGFDATSAAAKHRPGHALLLSMIEDAIANCSSTIDFLRGDESYKFDFTDGGEYNWNMRAVYGSANSGLRRFVYRLAKSVAIAFYLLEREIVLARVQFQQHGPLTFSFKYLQFRSSRFLKKFSTGNSTTADKA